MADRGLSRVFLDDLQIGCLAPLLERVKRDDTLHLAIRNEYINLFYRGGSLLKVSRAPSGAGVASTYTAAFDVKYFLGSRPKAFSECPARLHRDEYELKLCAAAFMGLGPFTQNLFGLPEFMNRMRGQIHSRDWARSDLLDWNPES
jgi:hypothetical protein